MCNVIQTFVNKYYEDLIDVLEENNEELTIDMIESDDFKIWFNEDWAADRWIDHVDAMIECMTDEEKTTLLLNEGLDNVFNMCKMIGTFEDPDNFTVDRLTWHVIDHKYMYDTIIRIFYNRFLIIKNAE